MGLYRGNYRLAHMSQALGRDEKATQISKHLGRRAFAYMLTDEQHAERVEKGRGGLPYRYLISSLDSAALPWTAFFDREELGVFLDAYGISLSQEPKPGDQFQLVMPDSVDAFQPLVEEDRVRFIKSMYGLRNVGFLEVDASTRELALKRASAFLKTEGPPLALLAISDVADLGQNLFRVRLK